MKREPKNYKIKKIHPRFFWEKCLVCKNEFKNEDMWKIESKKGLFYVCMECAKTREEIEAYIKAGNGIPLIVPLKSPGKPQTRLVKDGGKYGRFKTKKQEGWL